MEIKGKMYVRAKKWENKWLYSTSVQDGGDKAYAYLSVNFTKNANSKIKELKIKANDKGVIEIDVTSGWLKAYNGKVSIVIHDLEKPKEDKDEALNEHEDSNDDVPF
jgi:hypothetical protein